MNAERELSRRPPGCMPADFALREHVLMLGPIPAYLAQKARTQITLPLSQIDACHVLSALGPVLPQYLANGVETVSLLPQLERPRNSIASL